LHAVQIQPLLLPTLRIWNLDEENEKSFILREGKKKVGSISKQKCLNSVSAKWDFSSQLYLPAAEFNWRMLFKSIKVL
jgi:hypothetical protein